MPSAHTPGPSLTSKCPDCGHVYLSHFTVNHKCPLHAAALRMLKVLRFVATEMALPTLEEVNARNEARAILREIEGDLSGDRSAFPFQHRRSVEMASTLGRGDRMSEELATIEAATALAVPREPELVLEEAQRAAAALKRVIDAKPKKVMFGDEQYIEHEDWQTVGRFYGLAEQIIWTRPIQVGDASGWEARAEAIHVASARVVASAEAMCLNDEEKWRTRPKYAWVYHKKSGGTSVEDPGKDELIWDRNAEGKSRPKKSRELIGEESVPQFQLRSMAQTRAGAKALRNALGWVVVLAGYKPTPAEEMDNIAGLPREGDVERRGADAHPGGDRGARAEVSGPSGQHETTDEQAARLFKTPAEEERDEKLAVVEAIGKGFDMLGLSAVERTAKCFKHSGNQCETPDPDVMSLEALIALRDELQTLWRSRKSRERK